MPISRSFASVGDRSEVHRLSAGPPQGKPLAPSGGGERSELRGLISTAVHHEVHEWQHGGQRDDDRRHRHVHLVETQITDAERGENMGQVSRTAAGQQIDAVEVAHRPDHRQDRARQIQRAHRRPGDVAKLLPARGAIDRSRFVMLGRNGEPAGDQDQRPERQRLPDVDEHRDRQCQRRIVEPVGPVIAGEPEDQRVDESPFGIQHEADRQDRRNRRHRPRQDEQQRQPLDPRPLLNEKSRQQQRDDHLQVDADDHERQRVQNRACEDRIVEQLDVAVRMPREPQSVANGINHEHKKYDDVGRDEDESPFLPWGQSFFCQAGWRRRDIGNGDRDHSLIP
jgi:hypothetical protein